MKKHKVRRSRPSRFGIRAALILSMSMLLSSLLPPLSASALEPEEAAVVAEGKGTMIALGADSRSASVTAVAYDVTFGQSEARRMLPLVNSFRQGSEAWWYADDTKTSRVSAGTLQPLAYDYSLERAAMMRAAEAAIFFAHTRPSGASWSSLTSDYCSYCGENLAAGHATAADTTEQLKETNDGYSYQGHRRNMLGADYNAIGIGHAVFRGMHFWAQELAYVPTPNSSYAAPTDEAVTVVTGVRDDYAVISSNPVANPSVVKLRGADDRAYMPRAEYPSVMLRSDALASETWPAYPFSLSAIPEWEIDNEAVAGLEYGPTGDIARAKCSYGLTTCRGTSFGRQVTATIDVGPFSDVLPDTAHRGDIEWTHAQGVSQGWGPDAAGWRQFRPYASVARADMAAFLYRIGESMGVVDGGYAPSAAAMARFSDVDATTSHAKEIWWLAENGISTGWEDGSGKARFRPYATVARQDMAAFLFRLAKLANRGGASDSWQASAASKERFRDVDGNVPDNHHREVWWLAESGISAGWPVSGGRYEFRGMQDVARCDMAAFLKRMAQLGQ